MLTLGTGGVSLFAAQLALGRGARVIATTGSPTKAGRLQDLGIADVVDRNDAHWPERVREVTAGRGVDRVVEVAGSLGPALAATAVAGQVAFVGFLDGVLAPLDPMVLFRSVATVRTIAVGSRADFRALNRAIESTSLRLRHRSCFQLQRSRPGIPLLRCHQPLRQSGGPVCCRRGSVSVHRGVGERGHRGSLDASRLALGYR